jgi:hypothetical protein
MAFISNIHVKNVKKVTWGQTEVNVYYLDEGEKLGIRKVQQNKRVSKIPEEYKDLVDIVCGVDVLCHVHIETKAIKTEHSDLLSALGMM